MSHATNLSPRLEARRDRLLEAAELVFAREGLRGASMERIAAEAGVARATVYAYFTDKEDAFLQVSQRLARQMEAVVDAALAGPGAPAARVRNALLAKLLLAFRIARSSPQAADLMAAKDRLAGPIFAEMDRRIIATLAVALAQAAVPDPGHTAFVLLMGAKGVSHAVEDSAGLRAGVTLLVDAALRGLAAGAPRP